MEEQKRPHSSCTTIYIPQFTNYRSSSIFVRENVSFPKIETDALQTNVERAHHATTTTAAAAAVLVFVVVELLLLVVYYKALRRQTMTHQVVELRRQTTNN